jgi:hypothetical protein
LRNTILIFLAELNQMELWGANVGNAYLDAKTKEMVYIVAGPEFGEGIKRYQTMIGCLQWAVSLGRFDIQTAVMTMSRFRVAPRKNTLID